MAPIEWSSFVLREIRDDSLRDMAPDATIEATLCDGVLRTYVQRNDSYDVKQFGPCEACSDTSRHGTYCHACGRKKSRNEYATAARIAILVATFIACVVLSSLACLYVA